MNKELILEEIVDKLFKNKELFPIVNVITTYTKSLNLDKKDEVNFIYHYLRTKIGLEYILEDKIREVKYILMDSKMNQETRENFTQCFIRSILLIYADMTILTKEKQKQFDLL